MALSYESTRGGGDGQCTDGPEKRGRTSGIGHQPDGIVNILPQGGGSLVPGIDGAGS